jgi:glucose/arabinose dehydrogenase
MKLSVHGRTIGPLAALLAATLASSCSDGGDDNPAQPNTSSDAATGTPTTSGGSTAGPVTTGPGVTTTGNAAVTSSATGSATVTGAAGPTNGTTTAGVGGATTTATDTGSTGTPATTSSTSGGGTGGNDEWHFTGPRTPPLPLGSWPPPGIKLTEVATGANQPTAIAAPRFDSTRLYFTEKWGAIRLIKDGVLVAEPALDISAAVLEGGPQGSTGDELQHQGKRGLVGLAFHPDYVENGRIYVMYTADQGIAGYGTNDHTNLYDDGDMTIEEYRRSESDPDKFDPASKRLIKQWDKGDCDQCSQHNGGSLEIDVNGFLWASSGDPPPYDNPGSQDLNSLNGKLLRFDISGDEVVDAGNYPGADPAVASIGIRNAYKFSVDRYVGDVYVGDVGENVYEEVSVELYDAGHRNHGWPMQEATSTISGYCMGDNCLDPVFEYEHSGSEGDPGADNCIIGGYVYRGMAIPQLQGAYIYGDYGSGKIRALQIEAGVKKNGAHDFGLPAVFMGCFGEDAAGEMYLCDYNNGKILRIDAQ